MIAYTHHNTITHVTLLFNFSLYKNQKLKKAQKKWDDLFQCYTPSVLIGVCTHSKRLTYYLCYNRLKVTSIYLLRPSTSCCGRRFLFCLQTLAAPGLPYYLCPNGFIGFFGLCWTSLTLRSPVDFWYKLVQDAHNVTESGTT